MLEERSVLTLPFIESLILGAFGAAANPHSDSNRGYYDSTLVDNSIGAGAAIGSRAYSQTYGLESDTVGTRITVGAGYDPIKGAKQLAQPKKAKSETGNRSFWETHPPNEKRLANFEEIKANVGLRLNKNTAQ